MPYLWFALFLLAVPQLSPTEVVDRVSTTYGRMNSFSADFEQIQQDSSNQRLVMRGHVYLKTGKRARFEYSSPQVWTEYFDGKNYTKYTPEIKQAVVTPLNQADSDRLAIIQIVGNRETPWKNYFTRFVGSTTSQGTRLVELTPKDKDKDLQGVEIEVDPRTFFILRMMITTVDGQRNEFKFTNMQTAPIGDAFFKFAAPPGVQVIKE
jgi:chaperone LolA